MVHTNPNWNSVQVIDIFLIGCLLFTCWKWITNPTGWNLDTLDIIEINIQTDPKSEAECRITLHTLSASADLDQ